MTDLDIREIDKQISVRLKAIERDLGTINMVYGNNAIAGVYMDIKSNSKEIMETCDNAIAYLEVEE